jgi:hypothetical protein
MESPNRIQIRNSLVTSLPFLLPAEKDAYTGHGKYEHSNSVPSSTALFGWLLLLSTYTGFVLIMYGMFASKWMPDTGSLVTPGNLNLDSGLDQTGPLLLPADSNPGAGRPVFCHYKLGGHEVLSA